MYTLLESLTCIPRCHDWILTEKRMVRSGKTSKKPVKAEYNEGKNKRNDQQSGTALVKFDLKTVTLPALTTLQ